MAENEEDYLRKCLNTNTCPSCHNTLTTKVGSGQFKDGVFCSLGCQAKWHEKAMLLRHKERLKKEQPDG